MLGSKTRTCSELCSLILNFVVIQVEEEGRGRKLGEESGQCEDLLVEVNVNVRLTESGNVICKYYSLNTVCTIA